MPKSAKAGFEEKNLTYAKRVSEVRVGMGGEVEARVRVASSASPALQTLEAWAAGARRSPAKEDSASAADAWLERAVRVALCCDGVSNSDEVGALARRRGSSHLLCAAALREAAVRSGVGRGASYATRVAGLLGCDPYLMAALELETHALPSQPEYSRLRVARDGLKHAAQAAAQATSGVETTDEEDALGEAVTDAQAHAALLDCVRRLDVAGVKRLLVPPWGWRRAVFRCAATGRTPLHAACERGAPRDVSSEFAEFATGDARRPTAGLSMCTSVGGCLRLCRDWCRGFVTIF